jgi:hypothetical protein
MPSAPAGPDFAPHATDSPNQESPVSHHRLSLAAATIMAAALLPATAMADLVNLQSGDPTGTSFYRGFAATWNNPNGTGPIDAADLFGEDYSSNFGPQAVSSSRGITRGGSTQFGRSQGVPRGFYASSNFAEIEVFNANPDHQYYAVGGTGTKTALRVFDPFELARRATFTWTVTGVETLPPGVTGQATSRLDFGYSTDASSNWFDLFSNPAILNAETVLGTGTYSFTVPLQLGEPLYIHFWSSAFTQVDPGGAAAGSNFKLTANFASTFVLETIALFDEEDNELFYEWDAFDDETGETLFNAFGRVAAIEDAPPLPEVPVIPLPAPAGLLAAALGGLLLRRRKVAAC